MKKTLLILFFTQFLFAQIPVPSIEWQKCVGGTGNDNVVSVFQTSDGGYITAGNSYSTDIHAVGNHGSSDILVAKLDADGLVEWSNIYGGSSMEQVTKIIQTADGGYVFSGMTFSNDGDVSGNHGNSDVWVVKLNATGALTWQKTFGGSNADSGNDIIETGDGYLIAAQTYSYGGDVTLNHGTTDAWLLKISVLGNLTWQKTYGGSSFDSAVSVKQTTDGGFVFAGTTSSNNGDVTGNHNSSDFWIVKTSNSGTIQWQKSLGGTNSEMASSIEQTTDGGYIISGYTQSYDGDVTYLNGAKDYWLVKLNATGTIVWQKSFGGTQDEIAYQITQTTDGGYIVTGHTNSADLDVIYNHATNILTMDIWIVKLDANGTELWQKSLGNSGYQDSRFILQTADGGFIIAGNTGGTLGGDVTGFLGGNSDFWIVKLNAESLINAIFEENKFYIYPNPAKNMLHVNLPNEIITAIYITDMNGKKMSIIQSNSKIDVTNLTSGIYGIEIQLENQQVIKRKFIKQ